MALFVTRMGKCKRIVRDSGGAEIAEAALVLPILFMILLGIYWFGRAFNVYATINHAAREGARVAVVSTCATCGNTPVVTGNPTAIVNAVTGALEASKIDPSRIGHRGCSAPTQTPCSSGSLSCTNTSNIQICTGVQIKPVDGDVPAACGTSVSFGYPYNLDIPLTSVNNLCLKAEVQMQGEN